MKKIYRRMAIMGGMLALMAMPIKAQKWEHLADTPQMDGVHGTSFREISQRTSLKALPMQWWKQVCVMQDIPILT